MTVIIAPSDLAPFATIDTAKAEAMIADAMADASRVAPCITWDGAEDSETPAPSADQVAQFKSVLRSALLRWNDAGSGAMQTESTGPFSYALDTRQQRRGMFWPSEIEALQGICKGDDEPSGAFDINTVATCGVHSPVCSLYWGANYCSCGADLTGYEYPLYEDC